MNQKSRITHPPNRHQYGLASYMIRLSSLNIMIQRWYMFHSLYNASLDDERRMVSVIYNFQTFNIHWFQKYNLIIHIMFFSKDSFNNLIHRSHKMTSRITEIFTWLCFVGSMAILFWNSKKWNLKKTAVLQLLYSETWLRNITSTHELVALIPSSPNCGGMFHGREISQTL